MNHNDIITRIRVSTRVHARMYTQETFAVEMSELANRYKVPRNLRYRVIWSHLHKRFYEINSSRLAHKRVSSARVRN